MEVLLYDDYIKNSIWYCNMGSYFPIEYPIILTSIGGAFSKQTGTFCIALNVYAFCSFSAAWGSYLTGSPYMGTLFAILTE